MADAGMSQISVLLAVLQLRWLLPAQIYYISWFSSRLYKLYQLTSTSFTRVYSSMQSAGISTWIQEKSLQQISGAHQENILILGSIMMSYMAQNRHIITIFLTLAVSKTDF